MTVKLATVDIHGCPKEIFKSHPLGENSRKRCIPSPSLKLTAKHPEKWCFEDKPLGGKRPFYGGYLSSGEGRTGISFSREWRDLFFLLKTLSKLLHLGLMWVIIVLFRYKPHGFRPFANPIFVKQTQTSKKNKFPEILRIFGIIRRCSLFFGPFFLVQEKKKKEELPQNEVPDDEFFAQYMCLGRQFVLPWKLDKTCSFLFGWWEPLGLICLAKFPV